MVIYIANCSINKQSWPPVISLLIETWDLDLLFSIYPCPILSGHYGSDKACFVALKYIADGCATVLKCMWKSQIMSYTPVKINLKEVKKLSFYA